MRRIRVLIQGAVVLVTALGAGLGVVGALWYLTKAQTWVGVALALAGAGIALVPLASAGWALSLPPGRGWWRVATLPVGALGLLVLGLVLARTPTGSAGPNAPVSHQFTTEARFSRWHLANVVPEPEQVALGFQVMPHLDPLLSRERAERVAPAALALYREMEQAPNFRVLGSTMGWAYADLLGQPFQVGHYYLYVPRRPATGPRPALIFLHGSAGNWKVYTWLWSQLAEELGFVVIAPSFGFGNWRAPDSISTVLEALEDASGSTPIDPDHVYLAGLSNGGLGVSQVAAAAPERFRGLLFLSPVFDARAVEGTTFREAWCGRPVLVLTGDADERIPASYVHQRAQRLEAAGAAVTARFVPGADHFLIFTHADQVVAEVAAWLAEQEAGRPPPCA